MKFSMIYSPVLLLALVACGKSGSSTESPVALQSAEKIVSLKHTPSVAKRPEVKEAMAAVSNPVADENPTPIPQPVEGPTVGGPGVPAQPGVATPTSPTEEAGNLAEDPLTPEEEAVGEQPVTDPAELVGPVITTGNPSVDALCQGSFAALSATTQDELIANLPSVAANTACQNLLITTAGNLFKDLRALGVQIAIPNGATSLVLNETNFGQIIRAQPDASQLFLAYIDNTAMVDEVYYLANANEKLEYVQASIDELMAKPDAEFTQWDQQDLLMLQMSLQVEGATVNKYVQRIQRLNALAGFVDLAANVTYLQQILTQPAGLAPNAPAQPQPVPAPQTGTQPEPTPVPEQPAAQPQPAPEPTPAPQPEPTPAPQPAPAPAPVS